MVLNAQTYEVGLDLDGIGWKSLNASLLRVPLCSANNIPSLESVICYLYKSKVKAQQIYMLNFFKAKNLHRLKPWFQPRVKPKESEGRLKTDLEKIQTLYDDNIFVFFMMTICLYFYQIDCRENQ